jgi:nitroreductase
MTLSVQEAIRTRRTVKDYRPEPVPRQLVETVLEAVAWAPNHHLTQPWRLIVLEGPARTPLAELRRALKRRELLAKGLPPAQVEAEAAESAAKLLRAPVLIVVACQQVGDEIQRQEDFSATAAGIQNMLLTATELGLGSFWTSGPLAIAPETNALFGLSPSDRIVGIIHLGYPAVPLQRGQRPPPPIRWITPVEVPKLVAQVEHVVNSRTPTPA